MASDATLVTFGYQVSVGGYAGGWSENWWNLQDPGDALTSAILIMPELMAIHGQQVRLVNIRCSSTDRTKQSVSWQAGAGLLPNAPGGIAIPFGPVQLIVQPDQAPGGKGDMDFPTTSLLLESFQNSSGETTRVWVRGVPDARIEQAEYLPSKAYTSAIEAFSRVLKGNGFCIFKSARGGPRTVLTDVDQALGIFHATAHGLVVGQKIRVLRGKGIKGLNRSWVVMSVLTADTFLVTKWDATRYTGSYVKGSGSYKLYARNTLTMDGLRVVRATKHNIGRGPAVLRGRKRTKLWPVQGR